MSEIDTLRAALLARCDRAEPTDKGYQPLAHDSLVRFEDLSTPLLTLDPDALVGNATAMATWCRDHGVLLAPHGKTTMAPALWQLQLDAGAWGITVANEFQLRVAASAGIRRIIVANLLVSPSALELAARLADSGVEVICWVDAAATARRMDAILAHAGAGRVDVCAEMGVPGGRTGARDAASLAETIAAVEAATHLRLRGLAGYEGSVPGPDRLAQVHEFCDRMATALPFVADAVTDTEMLVSAGGSAWFDIVADTLGAAARTDGNTQVVLRSGAYLIHDHGVYARTTPSATRTGPVFVPAATLFTRVLSTPSPTLAILDAGKRDLAVDEGLPVVLSPSPTGADLKVARTNDQHAYVTSSAPHGLQPGDLVLLGESHPCTMLDKWRSLTLATPTPDGLLLHGRIRTEF